MRAAIPVIALLLASVPSAPAQEHKLLPHRSTASPQDHTMTRAGNPQDVSKWAKPSVEKHEGPGLVGGSRLFHGDGPREYDGTFSWDYQGFGWHPGRIFLGWSHDRKHQPKMGSYKTDTHKVPDVVTLHPVRKLLEPREP